MTEARLPLLQQWVQSLCFDLPQSEVDLHELRAVAAQLQIVGETRAELCAQISSRLAAGLEGESLLDFEKDLASITHASLSHNKRKATEAAEEPPAKRLPSVSDYLRLPIQILQQEFPPWLPWDTLTSLAETNKQHGPIVAEEKKRRRAELLMQCQLIQPSEDPSGWCLRKCLEKMWFGAVDGNLEHIRRLLYYLPIDLRDWQGSTLLSLAAEKGNSAVVEMLLRAGADPNVKDYRHSTPLMYAAQTKAKSTEKASSVVKLLLEAKAQPKALDLIGDSALSQSVDNLVISEMLLRAGADPNLKDSQGTPLVFKLFKNEDPHYVAEELPQFLRLFLAYGLDVSQPKRDGTTVLIKVAKYPGVQDFILDEVLWRDPLQVNARNWLGITALMKSAERKDNKFIDNLLENGADVNALSVLLESALSIAVKGDSISNAQKLIAAGADVNAALGTRNNPLEIARGRYTQNQQMIEMLLRHGAREPPSPAAIYNLFRAISKNDVEAAQALIEFDGADVNAHYTEPIHGITLLTPLAFAILVYISSEEASSGHYKPITGMIEMLLRQGADPNLTDDLGLDALNMAVVMAYPDIVKLLLENGADPNQVSIGGMTALQEALRAEERTPVVDILLMYGALVDVQEVAGTTPLLWAAQRQTDLNVVRRLIEVGLRQTGDSTFINRPNTLKQTPLMFAPTAEYASLLLEYGADPTLQDKLGNSALHYAATFGRADIVKVLVADPKRVDVNVRDATGITPLMVAAMVGQQGAPDIRALPHGLQPPSPYDGYILPKNTVEDPLQVAQLLIAAGANLNLQDNHGNTAYMLAEGFNHQAVAEALYTAGADTKLKNAQCDTTIQ